MSVSRGAPSDADEGVVIPVRHGDVRLQPVRWAWRDRIAFGAVTMLEGDTGAGKTLVAVELCSRWAYGYQMPDFTEWDGREGGAPVLYIGLDDQVAMVIAPRMEAAGGDPKGHVFYWPDGVDLQMPDHVDRVKTVVRSLEARIVVVDTFVRATNPDYEIGDYQAATAVVGAWDEIARETGAAVILVNHKTKSQATDTLSGGYGSKGGVNGVSRSVLIVRRDLVVEDARQYVLEVGKSNYGKIAPLLAYCIVTDRVRGLDPDGRLIQVETQLVEWLPSHVVRRAVDKKAADRVRRDDVEREACRAIVDAGYKGDASGFEAALLAKGVDEARAKGVRRKYCEAVMAGGARNARRWIMRPTWSGSQPDAVAVADAGDDQAQPDPVDPVGVADAVRVVEPVGVGAVADDFDLGPVP
jgi:hypothetical protein